MPSDVICTRLAAYEKSINGTAVIGPLKIKRDVVVILVPKLQIHLNANKEEVLELRATVKSLHLSRIEQA